LSDAHPSRQVLRHAGTPAYQLRELPSPPFRGEALYEYSNSRAGFNGWICAWVLLQLRSLLHVAASHGATDCVEYGLQHGVDPNDKDLDGRTPLYYACEILDETVAAALLRGGADPTIRNDDGCLAWHVRYVDLDDLQEMLNSIVEQLQLDTNKLPSPKLCPVR